RHQKPSLAARTRTRLDDDFHVAAQKDQKAQHSLEGEAGKAASLERRNLGLVHTQDSRGLRLSEPPFLNDGRNLPRELRLCERLFSSRKAEVGKDVAAASAVISL